jgi:capping protein alpha
VHNDIGQGRFYDPKSGRSFKYDHLRKEATDVQPCESQDAKAEPWRKALQQVGLIFIKGM